MTQFYLSGLDLYKVEGNQVRQLNIGSRRWELCCMTRSWLYCNAVKKTKVFEVCKRVTNTRDIWMETFKVFYTWEECRDWVAETRFYGFLIEDNVHPYIPIEDGVIG